MPSDYTPQLKEHYNRFDPARDRGLFDSLARSPLLPLNNALQCFTATLLAARGRPGFPYPLYSLGFSAMFGVASYMTYCKDYQNGTSVTTAWSLTWVLLHARKALRARAVPAMTIASVILVDGAIAGKKFFDL
ncbi:hypothetical protein H4R34_000041 [Dimargaris verticillata]|uniref:Uncharacterized protein n=1 Tax=Dimargaris verticillata TaxID=2761393 RepID=A0A9W8BE55_9FUNG|nr:hypothetical protein H4R34_000041 [Dimargaris verticillata]